MPSATPSKNRRKPARKGKLKRPSYRHGNLREALIAEAVKMMEERDDLAFTLREVAQRIRVSHTAAYRHFPSKGALLAEMAQRGFAVLAEGLASALTRGKSAREIILLQARAYVSTALQHEAFFRCMFGPKQFGPENSAAVDASCDACFDLLNQAATRLSEEHHIVTPPIAEIGLAMWSMAHGLANLALDRHLRELCDDTLESYAQLAENGARQLLAGLLPRPSRHAVD